MQTLLTVLVMTTAAFGTAALSAVAGSPAGSLLLPVLIAAFGTRGRRCGLRLRVDAGRVGRLDDRPVLPRPRAGTRRLYQRRSRSRRGDRWKARRRSRSLRSPSLIVALTEPTK
ncbi:hypothetical protein AB0E27_11640 [Streptomyces sparsogenes]|uniref:hypothetical protein n=1 Tax=Streptomyces sparsogenes TaxID=67365 RepID=UPI0033DED1B4